MSQLKNDGRSQLGKKPWDVQLRDLTLQCTMNPGGYDLSR